MDPYKITHDTWNKIAKVYADKFLDIELYNESYDFFLAALPKELASVLDVGCGPGSIMKYLLKKSPNLKLKGIDVAPNMLELCKEFVPSAQTQVLDARELQKLNGKFDGIIAGFCLPYLSEVEVEKLCFDAHYLLNPYGILYLSFVEGNPSASGFQQNSYGDGMLFYYHDTQKIKTILEKHYVLIKEFSIDYEHDENNRSVHKVLICRLS